MRIVCKILFQAAEALDFLAIEKKLEFSLSCTLVKNGELETLNFGDLFAPEPPTIKNRKLYQQKIVLRGANEPCNLQLF